ncbi:MAG: sulfate ABC transporter substrate-binding protein [Fimbriiglobus sp.]
MIARIVFLIVALYLLFAACWVVSSGFVRNEGLLNVACDPTRELWQDVNEHFCRDYAAQVGKDVQIKMSHGGSASQARAVIDGLDADVVTLALWTDTDAIRKAGRIEPGWETRLPNRSLPFVSTMVFVVRKGNPKQIRDWADLDRPDVQVMTPNPKTSGNGKWSLLALWGSVVTRGGSEQQATDYLTRIYSRVPLLDASARGSTMSFAQKKLGEVHITWENEAHLEVQEANGELEIVTPTVSILAEPHVAMVDAVVARKGTKPMAEAYLNYLYTEPAQELMAKHYYRPTSEVVLKRHSNRFPAIRFFTVRDLASDWDVIQQKFFAEEALFDRILVAGRKR